MPSEKANDILSLRLDNNSNYNVFAYQMFDQAVQINASTGQMSISEDI